MDKAKEIYSKMIKDDHDRLILVADFDKMQKIIEDLQQRIAKAVEWCECVINCETTAGDLPNGTHTDMGYCLDLAEPLLNILKGEDTNE